MTLKHTYIVSLSDFQGVLNGSFSYIGISQCGEYGAAGVHTNKKLQEVHVALWCGVKERGL